MNQTHEVLETAQQLSRDGQAFAMVTVLRVLAPASAKPGDKALVTSAGIVEGWIGGGCAQPAVIKAVRRALADGCSRMIRISPAAQGEERELDEVLEFGMSCQSGGTLELFVDPVLPKPSLTVIGDTPLSRALTVLAPRVGLPALVIAHGAEASQFPDAKHVLVDDQQIPPDIKALAKHGYVVVATQGKRDLQGLRAALALDSRGIFFVASTRKAQILKKALVEMGENENAVEAIIAPAGQAIGAQTPPEIALSVIAAVVAQKRLPGRIAEAIPVPHVAETRPIPDAAETIPIPHVADEPLPVTAASTKSCCGS